MPKKENNILILDKKYFEKFFLSLKKRFKIFGPSVNNENGFVEVDSFDKMKLDYTNTKISPKGFFFPQTETLLFFDTVTNATRQKETDANSKDEGKILFGIRPCDAMSISLLNRVFSEVDPPDPYFKKRMQSTRIISFACTNPQVTCFCTSVGCGPDSEKGADIILYKMNGRYLLKVITPEGNEMLASVRDILKPATKDDIEEKETLMHNVKSKIKKMFNIDKLKTKLENFDAPYWKKLHQKCLGCGICTYLCPTCHCFDITDEVTKSCGRRVRTWDSCMFPLFTLHASGHNPRPTQKERMRQRIMHKFNYAPKNYGEAFCVGCGRCIIYCPVNIDIRLTIKKIMEEK